VVTLIDYTINKQRHPPRITEEGFFKSFLRNHSPRVVLWRTISLIEFIKIIKACINLVVFTLY